MALGSLLKSCAISVWLKSMCTMNHHEDITHRRLQHSFTSEHRSMACFRLWSSKPISCIILRVLNFASHVSLPNSHTHIIYYNQSQHFREPPIHVSFDCHCHQKIINSCIMNDLSATETSLLTIFVPHSSLINAPVKFLKNPQHDWSSQPSSSNPE